MSIPARADSVKKNAAVEGCVKSTPKEEGGGDTGLNRMPLVAAFNDSTETDYPCRRSKQQAFFVHRTINILIVE
jgi:hypothetical protein